MGCDNSTNDGAKLNGEEEIDNADVIQNQFR